jgi:hypothetical protein
VLYFDIKNDEGLGRLKGMANFVIGKFVDGGIIERKELSHIKYNSALDYYDMKFHLSIINTKRGETFNAKPAIEKFRDTTLGVLQVTEIHISNRAEIDTYDGKRVNRKEFNFAEEEGFYSCDGKVILVDDSL